MRFQLLCMVIVMSGLMSGCGSSGSGNSTDDITPPATTVALSVSGATSTGATMSVTINENGTGYYLVLPAATSAPTVAAIQAGTSFAMTANVAATQAIGGLTPLAPYTIYFVAKDAANNLQSAVSAVAVTTTANLITDRTTGMLLLKIPGGSFTMGDTFGDGYSSYELPTHQVNVGDFYIGKYEVTQGQWQAVMGSNPSYFAACGADCPVENVSWNDIQIFITTLNLQSGKSYRLPTEAEWEYAARSGGQSEKYSGGSDINAVAWYSVNSGGTTHQLGQKKANGLGLYDMNGNVWEWVNDWYGTYDSAPQTNPTGPATGSGPVSRGGGYGNGADVVRASFRNYGTPSLRGSFQGFRLAAPVQ